MSTIGERGGDGIRTVWSVDCLPDVEVLSFEGSSRTFSYYNDVYAIAVLFCAEGEVKYRGRDHHASSGQVGLIQPDGIFCRRRPPIPERVTKILIKPSAMEEAAHDLGITEGAVFFDKLLVWSPSMFQALSVLDRCLRMKSTPLEIQTSYCTALEMVLGHARRPPRNLAEAGLRAARQARDILHARFKEPVTLAALAKDSGVSTFHLVRTFRRQFGLPPHAYQNHLRVAQARRLLRQGQSMSRVAVEVGFTDQSHLNRHFTRAFGMTPSAWTPRSKTCAKSRGR